MFPDTEQALLTAPVVHTRVSPRKDLECPAAIPKLCTTVQAPGRSEASGRNAFILCPASYGPELIDYPLGARIVRQARKQVGPE